MAFSHPMRAYVMLCVCVFYTSGVRVCYWYDLSSTINKRHPNEIVRIDFNRSHKKKNGGDVKWMANDKRRNVNWCAHTNVCTRNFNSVNLIEWLEMCFLVRHPFLCIVFGKQEENPNCIGITLNSEHTIHTASMPVMSLFCVWQAKNGGNKLT